MGGGKEKMEEEEEGEEGEEGREREGRGGASFAELFPNTVSYFHLSVIDTTQWNFQQSKNRYNGEVCNPFLTRFNYTAQAVSHNPPV